MTLPTLNRNTRVVLLGLLLSAAGGFGLVALASAHDGPPAGARHAVMHAPAPGGMPLLGGPGLERLLDELKATPEQRSQLKNIADAARQDLAAQRDGAEAERAQWLALFAQPQVDATAAEALRQKMLARHDAGSKRITQALLDSSRVLSAEQRQQLAALWQARGQPGMGGPGRPEEGHRGGHHGAAPRG